MYLIQNQDERQQLMSLVTTIQETQPTPQMLEDVNSYLTELTQRESLTLEQVQHFHSYLVQESIVRVVIEDFLLPLNHLFARLGMMIEISDELYQSCQQPRDGLSLKSLADQQWEEQEILHCLRRVLFTLEQAQFQFIPASLGAVMGAPDLSSEDVELLTQLIQIFYDKGQLAQEATHGDYFLLFSLKAPYRWLGTPFFLAEDLEEAPWLPETVLPLHFTHSFVQ